MKIDASLTFNKVQFNQETEAHLVLNLQAPAVAVEDKRPPLCIIPLLDISGSMAGEKLAYAKRSLIKLIDHLSANDYCGLVTFTNVAEVVAKPVRCTKEAKEDLKRKVGDLHACTSTNIADALLQGFGIVNSMDLAIEVILRVILFTDGAANEGPAKTPKDILALVKPNIGRASVSAFGYGFDAQQDFLLNLAKSGNGNYSFVQNPDDALSVFGKELGGLLSTYATGLVLEIAPLAGHQITQVVSDVDVDEDDLGQVSIRIPDILSEETRNLVLAIKLQSQKSALPRAVNVFDVKFGYDILDANLRKERKILEAKVKVQFVKEGEQDTVPDAALDRIVGLAQIVRAQIEAEEQAKQGNFAQAAGLMQSVSAHIGARGLVDLGAVANNIGACMGSSAAYVSNASYLTSMSRGATRGMGGTYSVAANRDLKTAGVILSNEAQSNIAASFEAEDGDTEVVVPFSPPPTTFDLPNVVVPASITISSVVDFNGSPLYLEAAPSVGDIASLPGKFSKKKVSQKSKRW